MKILEVGANSRRRSFDLQTESGHYRFPFAKLHLSPTPDKRVEEVYPDPEAGGEAFTYRLESGGEDTVHLDVVLDHDPP